jgi:hypothetical protein
LKGRRFFFGTRADLLPGLRAVEEAETLAYVVYEMRDDTRFTVLSALSADPGVGYNTGGGVLGSPTYLVFRRGEVPAPESVPQRRGDTKYIIYPTPDCLILRCGGLHAPTGALVAGELQHLVEPEPSRGGIELFRLFSRELLRGFKRVGLYWVGPEALEGLRAGQRLVTIDVRSPREYDLAVPGT